MRILMVNKFLHRAGGAETYLFELGEHLTRLGHQVQYFGMDHPDNTVGNAKGLYTANMDFHGKSVVQKLSYPFRIISSREARRKMGAVLADFQPDVIHVNNFNYQLTPSILLAARDYGKKHPVKLLYTAHDVQLVCPNHLMYRPQLRQVCQRCQQEGVRACIRGKCIHDSRARSILGALEHWYWKKRRVYRLFDTILCPSEFMKSRLDLDPVLAERTVMLRNFVKKPDVKSGEKGKYVLFFGRYSEEKGIRTLLEVCARQEDIPFVFAGGGPLEELVRGAQNVKDMGFLTGAALTDLIAGARFTVCPSECNENCPFSVMESLMAGTPVLGSDRGGIPELIQDGCTGWLFPAADAEALGARIRQLYFSDEPERCAENCTRVRFDNLEEYTQKLMEYYS